MMGIVARPLLIAFLLAAVISPALAKPPVTKGSKVETVPARSDLDDLASDSASLRASVSRAAQKMAAAQQPGPAAPIPKPDPVRAAKADHTVRITNMSGVVQRNYPLRFARPFICGEIAHYPQLLVNGAAAPTQADVRESLPGWLGQIRSHLGGNPVAAGEWQCRADFPGSAERQQHSHRGGRSAGAVPRFRRRDPNIGCSCRGKDLGLSPADVG